MRTSQPWKTNRARTLRANTSSAEDIIWGRLRNGQLGGFKFVRQAPIDRFFADFLCRKVCLVVEIDGGTHGEAREIERDAERSSVIEGLGYRILRAHNADVYENIDGILEGILAVLEGRAG
jgi:very-short-patch-repair endonuclease